MNDDLETNVINKIQDIIKKVHENARQKKRYDMKDEDSSKDKLDDDINKILDHTSMKTQITDHAAEHLCFNISHSVLFSELHFSIILLSHQFNEVSTMRKQK